MKNKIEFDIPQEIPRFRTMEEVNAFLPKLNERQRESILQVADTTFRVREEMIMKFGRMSDTEFLLGYNPSELSISFYAKEYYNSLGMYGFVSHRWVKPFAEWIGNRKVLEVMAGAGHLSYALKQYGVDVIATDNNSWANERGWEPVTEVMEADSVEAINLWGDKIDILLMSWPYMDDTAYRTIKQLNEVNPNALIVYIGEGNGGCTASEEFFDHFNQINDDKKFNIAEALFQRWPGIHDYLCLGRYK
jgi:hypothetical protein